MNFKRLTTLPGIELFQVVQTDHVFPKHSHESRYLIGLMEKGASYCVGEEDSDTVVTSGDVYLINPGQVHSGIPVDKKHVSYSMLSVDHSYMSNVASDMMEKDSQIPEFNTLVVSDEIARKNLLSVFHLLSTLTVDLETEAVLMESLCRLLNQYSDKSPKSVLVGEEKKGIRLAKEFLSERLDEKLSLKEVADIAGFSQYYFIRLFKQRTGVSPHVYRVQQRIEAAKELLKKGTPLSETAGVTGFSDQSHFTNTFKNYTGVTPRQYCE